MVPFNQNDLAIKAFDKARCVVIPCLPYHVPQNIDEVTFAFHLRIISASISSTEAKGRLSNRMTHSCPK